MLKKRNMDIVSCNFEFVVLKPKTCDDHCNCFASSRSVDDVSIDTPVKLAEVNFMWTYLSQMKNSAISSKFSTNKRTFDCMITGVSIISDQGEMNAT